MVIELIHAFVSSVNRFGLVRNLHAALIKNFIDILWIEVLQIIEIYRL